MSFIRSAFLRDLQNLPAKRKRKQRSIFTVASNPDVHDDLTFREVIQPPELQSNVKRRKLLNVDVVETGNGSGSSGVSSPSTSLAVSSDSPTPCESVTNNFLVPRKVPDPTFDFIERANENEESEIEVSKNTQTGHHNIQLNKRNGYLKGLDMAKRKSIIEEEFDRYDLWNSKSKHVREKQQETLPRESKMSREKAISTHVKYADHDTQVFRKSTNQINVNQNSPPCSCSYTYEKAFIYHSEKLKGVQCTINSHHVFNKKYIMLLQTPKRNSYAGVLNNYADAKKAGRKMLETILACTQLEVGKKDKKSFTGSESEISAGAEMLYPKVFRDNYGILELRSAGCLITEGDDRHNYHTKRFLYPVGFCSVRSYTSLSNPAQKVDYYCEIHEGEEGPRFVVHESGSLERFESKSMSGAWGQVLERINQKRKELGVPMRTKALSGPQMFGFHIPPLLAILESLPGVSNCENYCPDAFRISEIDMGESYACAGKGLVNTLDDHVTSKYLRDMPLQIPLVLI